MFTIIQQIVQGLVSGVVGPLFTWLNKKQDAQLAGFQTAAGIDATAYGAFLTYQLGITQAKAAANSWWGARALYLIVGGAAAAHTAAVFVDSTVKLGCGHYGCLGVPAPNRLRRLRAHHRLLAVRRLDDRAAGLRRHSVAASEVEGPQTMIVFRLQTEARSHLLNRLPEWIAAGFLFALGAQLSRPGDGFALSHIYDILGRMATEREWAFAALIISTVRFVALILNGFFPFIRRITPAVRSLSAFASGCVWLALTIGLIMFNTSVLGIVAHAGWACLDFTYAVVVAHEAAETLSRAVHAASRER